MRKCRAPRGRGEEKGKERKTEEEGEDGWKVCFTFPLMRIAARTRSYELLSADWASSLSHRWSSESFLVLSRSLSFLHFPSGGVRDVHCKAGEV